MNERITIHMDYVDGVSWTECSDDLPLCSQEYSLYPTSVLTSIPCKVITTDGRYCQAIYVVAESVALCNDGSHTRWAGWAEMSGDADDYSCVEKVLQGETLVVLRWHYPKGAQMPTQKGCEKMLEMQKYIDSAADFIDSHPKEWPLVREDGTVIAAGPAEIVGSGTEPVKRT